eukprot:gnl/TRDRNA2_/TRDRNA2_91106_c0_seq1.p1 gnl/TRDRNA2_/TRDRNA2_91106_c0~~gnl/TRDRNA2_/TRDRNA2_91106_c0_seq1.p1  ORF type:complete len:353 (+),score=68.20 gnl/TRDRNA2_/TRDRNA2_91106_c0_seq1:155-1060(+)
MARILKIFRSMNAFDSMFLLTRSIQASVGALFWSFTLLFFVQVVIGLFISQVLRSYMESTSDPDLQAKVFMYFGTFTRTMITMFEITLANWVPSCRLLMDNVSEWFGLFYLTYRGMFCFAVLKVISAVFITETHRVATGDDEIAIRAKQRAKGEYLRKLRDVFQELDDSGDGILVWEEFEQLLSDDLLTSWLSTLEIAPADLKKLWTLIDDGHGRVAREEFLASVPRIRGQAREIDVAEVLLMSSRIEQKLEVLMCERCSQVPQTVHPAKTAGVLSPESILFEVCGTTPLANGNRKDVARL